MLDILSIPLQIIRGCVTLLNSVEIVSGVSMWNFFIVIAIISGMASIFWRSGKY